jgi:cobaltochelatase CobN
MRCLHIVALFLAVIGQSPAWAQAPAADGQRLVLLATYVVSPARLARLQAAAVQTGVAMQTLSADQDTPDTLAKALRDARLLVVDAPHGSVAQTAAARFGDVIKKSGKPYVVVGEFSAVVKNQPFEVAPLQAEAGVSAAWAQRLREYWRFGGAQNMRLAMTALQSHAVQGTGVAGLAPAVQLPLAGFYNPGWPHIEADAQSVENRFSSASNKALWQHL